MENKQTQDLYEFDGFRLDTQKRRLMHGGEMIPLTPKEFDLLFLLIQNAGRVVEKNELLQTIWKDTFVEEGTLTRNISWLRKKLAAHGASDKKIIETLPKRGYRFLPEINAKKTSFVVEEQTIQRIQIEEIIEIDDSPSDDKATQRDYSVISNRNQKLLPAAPPKNRFLPLWILSAFLILVIVAALATTILFSQKQPEVIIPAKIVPFSGLPGRENFPAFSPDGKQIVFSWDGGVENGNSDIYVKLIGAGDPVRLTTSETDEINPVFSPDGKSIAFLRILPTHREIVLIPALGGAERKIYEKASFASFSFSPDGNLLATAEVDLSNNDAGIYTINLQTGEKKRLTKPPAPAVDHTPRFSPDGKHLAFIRYFNSFRREICVIPATGGEPRQITADDVRIYGLAWMPDSRSLLFTSFRRVNQLNLWKVSLNAADEPQIISTGGKNLQDVAISPDGKTVAFVEETADENIWEIEPNAKPQIIIRSPRADHSPQISPDGAKMAFASDRTGNYEIWIADTNGKNQRQLTAETGSAGSPRFSPDGKFIAYDSQIASGSGIYTVSVNGGDPRLLIVDGKNNSLPAWSADGNWIFFLSDRTGSNQIWKIPATGGEAVQITRQGAFEMFAAPNGKEIIYSKGAGKTGLWSVETDGSDEKPILELSEAGFWRSWTVTANGVYFVTVTGLSPYRLKFFDFATRRISEIMTIEKPPLSYYSNLSLSPNEKKIFYAQQDQSASAIMLAGLDRKE